MKEPRTVAGLPAGLDYVEQRLTFDGASLDDLAARFGTPLWAYSAERLRTNYRRYSDALADIDHLICYAVKANGNLSLLALLAELGSGFDIVSGGELARVLRAGGDPRRIVFSGVGKTVAEMEAALDAGILCFNVESTAELDLLSATASGHGIQAPVSLRINPDVDPGTHPYIATGLRDNKFGIAMSEALALCLRAADLPGIRLTGVDCHIGSQLTELAPMLDAAARIFELLDRLEEAGQHIEHVDLGGGLGVRYGDESPPDIETWAASLRQLSGRRRQRIILEPGRSLVADAGLLLTRVLYTKQQPAGRHFTIVDAGMNDNLRPALYNVSHPVLPVATGTATERLTDVVGPVCESGDFQALQCPLDAAAGELLAIGMCGAYGSVMSSNYNARGRAAEILIEEGEARPIRRRESIDEQMALEIPCLQHRQPATRTNGG